ncbi:MAG: hypothetical protein AAB396_02475, partial [Patescibacteria group bacterium]
MITLKFIFTFLFIFVVFHFLALYNFWYWEFRWLDMPMHFFGGFLIAIFFIWLNLRFKILSDYSNSRLSNYLITVLISLSFVSLIGVLWEFQEFLYDIFISSKSSNIILQLSAADTIKDLFFDLLGGIVFLSVYLIKLKNPRLL